MYLVMHERVCVCPYLDGACVVHRSSLQARGQYGVDISLPNWFPGSQTGNHSWRQMSLPADLSVQPWIINKLYNQLALNIHMKFSKNI